VVENSNQRANIGDSTTNGGRRRTITRSGWVIYPKPKEPTFKERIRARKLLRDTEPKAPTSSEHQTSWGAEPSHGESGELANTAAPEGLTVVVEKPPPVYSMSDQHQAQTRIASWHRGIKDRTLVLRVREWNANWESPYGTRHRTVLLANAYGAWGIFTGSAVFFNLIWGLKFDSPKMRQWLLTGTAITCLDLFVIQLLKILLIWLVRKRILFCFMMLVYAGLVGFVVMCEDATSSTSSLDEDTGNLICDLIPA